MRIGVTISTSSATRPLREQGYRVRTHAQTVCCEGSVRRRPQDGEPGILAWTTAGGPRYHCAEMSARLRTSPTGRNGHEDLSTTEGRARASVTLGCAVAPG